MHLSSKHSSHSIKSILRILQMSSYWVLATCIILSGCASWDDDVVAPEDFRSSYLKLHDCKESQHPEARYVISWLSPNATSIWEAWADGGEDVDFEVGTVSVKAQYSDKNCANLKNYTLMEKVDEESSDELGGWRWQYVNDSGECINCNGGIGCAGCHSACSIGPDYFCTSPE